MQNELTIAISTIGDRSKKVVLPMPTPGLEILLLVQNPPTDLETVDRKDLKTIMVEETGVVASRNAAIDCAQSEFLLFADDDISLNMDSVHQMKRYLRENTEQSVVTGYLDSKKSNEQQKLRLWNVARYGTPEIMIRLADIRRQYIRFDRRFGIGARYPLGDEFVFLADILKSGLNGQHLPVMIGSHYGESTGAQWADQALFTARAATMQRVFGKTACLYAFAFALRHFFKTGGLKGMISFVYLSMRPIE